MKKIIANSIAFVTAFAPVAVLAQTQLNNVNDVVSKATNIGNTFITVLISLAVVWIIFNVVRYLILGADSEDARAKAKDSILYGVIGLVVILSIWGLVAIVRNSLVTNNNVPVNQFPKVQPAPQI